ncbi:hypothetical protein [Halobaculum sp. D14]|uniref:hypothetical protein n=1 Tax=Halobaculum sp. D14 TaxID=3421642 RepID=UPI003EB7BBA6
MLLSVFAALTVLGVGLWLLGYTFDFIGVAAIGSIIVIGAGAMVILGSLEVEAGETLAKQFTTVNSTVVNNATTVTQQYRKVTFPQQFTLGSLVTTTGGLLFIHAMDHARDA